MNDMCTCGQHDCYSCRYQQILDTAEKIYQREVKWCKGMQGFDVEAHAARMANNWRCKALNLLAFEFAGL